VLATLAALASTAPAWAQQSDADAQRNLDQEIAMLRSNLQSARTQLIAKNMDLSADEAARFWPIYNRYQAAQAELGDAKLAAIKDYLANVSHMDDQKAAALTNTAIGLEEKRLALVKQYLGEFAQVLPAKQVARFYQIDTAIQRLVDLQVGASLPLVR
jgi:Spy/CpxP family protein refolding chaperone